MIKRIRPPRVKRPKLTKPKRATPHTAGTVKRTAVTRVVAKTKSRIVSHIKPKLKADVHKPGRRK